MTSASKLARPQCKLALPPRRFDIHQEARPEANHAASGILEVAAHNSSRRIAIESVRSGQKPGSRCWPEILTFLLTLAFSPSLAALASSPAW